MHCTGQETFFNDHLYTKILFPHLRNFVIYWSDLHKTWKLELEDLGAGATANTSFLHSARRLTN